MSLEDYSQYKLQLIRGGAFSWRKFGKSLVAVGATGLAALLLANHLANRQQNDGLAPVGNHELAEIDYHGIPPEYIQRSAINGGKCKSKK